MDIEKMKDLLYIKGGEILKSYAAHDAILEKEADDIINEVGLGEGNKGHAQSENNGQSNEGIESLLNTIVQSFKAGPLSWKPSFETEHHSDFKKDFKRKDTSIEGNVAGKSDSYAVLSVGETELAKANCNNMLEGHINAAKTSEPLDEKGSENRDKQTNLNFDGEFKCRSEGGAHIGTGKYTAKADYEITFETKADAKLSYHGKRERRTTNGDKSIHEKELGRFAGECKFQTSSSGYVKAGAMNHELRGEYDAGVHLDTSAKAKCRSIRKINSTDEKRLTVLDANAKGHMAGKLHGHVGFNTAKRTYNASIDIDAKADGQAKGKLLDAQVYKKHREVGGEIKILHGKAKGQAELTFSASAGERKKSLKGKIKAEAGISLLDGKACLGLKKREDGSYFVPGVKCTVGKCTAKASIEQEKGTPSEKGKRRWKAGVSGVTVNALSADIRKTEKIDSEVKVDLKGVEVNALNAKVTGIRENKSINATVEGRGIQANVGNLAVTGIDKNESVSVSVKTPGLVANIGNVQVTGLKTGGVDATVDTSTGVNAFNASFGLRGDTGVSVNSQFSFGNINMTLGPPRLDIGFGFNIGVPFFSGGSNGSGGFAGNTSSASPSENTKNDQKENSVGIDNSNSNVPRNTGTMNNGSFKIERTPHGNHSYIKGDKSKRHLKDTGEVRRDSLFTNKNGEQYSAINGSDRQRYGVHDEDVSDSFAYTESKTSNEASCRSNMKSNSKNVDSTCKRDTPQGKGKQNGCNLEDGQVDIGFSLEQPMFPTRTVSTDHFDTGPDMGSGFGYGIDESATSDVSDADVSAYDIGVTQGRNMSIEESSDDEGHISKQPNGLEYGMAQDSYATEAYAGNGTYIWTNDSAVTDLNQHAENDINEITIGNGRGLEDENLYNGSERTPHGSSQNEQQAGPSIKPEGINTPRQTLDCNEPDITSTTKNSKQKTYNSVLLERIRKKISKNEDIDNDSNKSSVKEAWDSKNLDGMNRDELKKCLKETYKKGCVEYSGKQSNGSTRNEDSKKERKPTTNKKKPFGEKKNIHTIFTLNGNDGKEIRYLKSNVACFGDDD